MMRSQFSGAVAVIGFPPSSACTGPWSIAPPALEDVHVDLDAETRTLGRIRKPVLDPERTGEQILGVIEHAASIAVGSEIGHRHAEVNLRRGADAELGHAAD